MIHPTIAASLAGFTPSRQRTPAHTHWTTTGEGGAEVECRFDIDRDGDIETLQVWMGKTDIFQALTEAQIVELDAECLAAYKAKNEARRYDTAIDYAAERRAA